MSNPDLADLDAFAAVARARSFRGAALQQGGSASALSDAVRRLEGRLNVRLLNRTTRSVTPTDAGQRLLDRLLPALGEVTAALDGLNSFRDTATGTLRLNVPEIVARAVLPPIAVRFLLQHPGITLEVRSDNSFVDVVATGFDAGIRYEERLDADMIAVPIGPRRQRFVAAAAPSYLAARGRPEHPRDLLAHACIRHRFSSGVMAAWEFERGDEALKISPSGPLVANSIELMLAAAVAGLGIVASFEEFVLPALRSGELVPVLEDWTPSFSGPFLYYAGRRHVPAPLRAFIDFLKREPAGAHSHSIVPGGLEVTS